MTPDEFQSTLVDVNTVMLGDLHTLWSQAETMDEDQFRSFIVSSYPDAVSPYIGLSADLATDWYDNTAPELAYKATPADLPPEAQLYASAGWATSTDSLSVDAAFALLAGSAQRAVFNGARETIIQNSQREPGARWARHASANACRFCQMLATRGAVYVSADSASMVDSGRTARTQASPVRPQGIQSLGQKYHDHCHCIAVMVRPGGSYTPPPYVDGWEADYRSATKLAGSTNTQAVMAAYRQMDSNN